MKITLVPEISRFFLYYNFDVIVYGIPKVNIQHCDNFNSFNSFMMEIPII